MNCDKYGKDRDEEERQEKETCSKSRCTSDRDAVNTNPQRVSATHSTSTPPLLLMCGEDRTVLIILFVLIWTSNLIQFNA